MKEGWSEVRLGEIAELRGRIGWKGLTAKEYQKSGPRFLSVHSLNYGDFVDFRDAFHISQERYDESPEIMIQRDDVLICKDGAGIGKLGIVPEVTEPTTLNSSLLLIRPGAGIIPKYLYFCLLSPYFQSIVQSRLEGATTPHLYQRDITTFPVLLPPLEEQRRIVAILDEALEGLDRARANAEANLASARELFESVLDQAFCADADETAAVLSEHIDISHGLAFDGADFDLSNDDDKQIILTPGNYTEDATLNFSMKNTKRLAVPGPPKYLFRDGDLTVVMTDLSSRMKILGRPAFISGSNVLHNQRIGRVIINSDKVLARWIYYFLQTSSARASIISTATGTMVRHTAPKRILNLRIPLPSLAKQTSKADRLDAARAEFWRLRDNYDFMLKSIVDLRQSLLQMAIAGELT